MNLLASMRPQQNAAEDEDLGMIEALKNLASMRPQQNAAEDLAQDINRRAVNLPLQ